MLFYYEMIIILGSNKMNKKYLITIDLDGTLLIDHHYITEFTKDILYKVNQLGHHIVIATGRPFKTSETFYNELKLNTPIINLNGSYIHNPKNEKFAHILYELPNQELINFTTEIEKYIINGFFENPKHVFMLKERLNDKNDGWFIADNIIYGDFKETLNEPVCGGIIFTDQKYTNEVFKISQKYSDTFKLRNWGDEKYDVFEIFNPHINKGIALKILAKNLNIDPENTIAFGDGLNDIEMLRCAKHSISFENATTSAKNAAKTVTIPNDQDAVAKYLKDFFKL